MAAGLVTHNLTTAAGISYTVVAWVPDTGAPDVGAVPLHAILNTAGDGIVNVEGLLGALAQESGGNLAGILAKQDDIITAIEDATVDLDSLFPKIVQGTFTTLTRPGNQTPYAVGDSVSDNATAGSVTALVATLADANDNPVSLTEMHLNSTDTGFGGAVMRAYIYNSDPTANSGVVAGDNAAFSNKKAGLLGTMVGTMRGMSDGSVGRLSPEDGASMLASPGSSARTFWYQLQTLSTATSSANSTTFIGTLKGIQARA